MDSKNEPGFIRRTGECRVKLSPEMMARLDALATAHGFPMATMAAVAVAEWINSKEQNAKNQKMMMLDMGRQIAGEMGKVFGVMADSPELLNQAEEVARRAQEQLNLPSIGSGSQGG